MTAFRHVWSQTSPDLRVEAADVTRGDRAWTQTRVVVGAGRAGVVVVPIHGEQIGFVRLWRPCVDEVRLELPRGFGESPDPELDARRELLEETGLDATHVTRLATLDLDTGLVPTPIIAFATQLDSRRPTRTPDGETDDLVWVDATSVSRLVAEGTLRDGITLAALAAWWASPN